MGKVSDNQISGIYGTVFPVFSSDTSGLVPPSSSGKGACTSACSNREPQKLAALRPVNAKQDPSKASELFSTACFLLPRFGGAVGHRHRRRRVIAEQGSSHIEF